MAKTILILAANPKDTLRLRLDEEVREIGNGLQRAKRRDEFNLKQAWAVRHADFRRAMLDSKPNIVHFCGHGSGEEGIAFEDENGLAKLVSTEALSGFFELFADKVECVVLNACYSESQAEAIAKYIPCVVGMKKEIGDAAALEFASAFYDALGAGETIEFAYKLACNAIQLAGLPEHLSPILKKHPIKIKEISDSTERSANQQSNPLQTQISVPSNNIVTGVMNKARHHHMTALFSNGEVLVVGGYDHTAQEALSSVEIWKPSNQIFTMHGKMSFRRYFSAAVSLPENLLLVCGGIGERGEVLDTVEVYNHRIGTFSIVGRMTTPRRGHIAVLLQNGKVLIAGGQDDKGLTLATAEIYDPVENKFTATGKMCVGRLTEHTPNAILLPTGHIMIAGGYDGIHGELVSVEFYDPGKGIFMNCGNMAIQRACHTLTLVSNDKVLIVGGHNDVSGHLKSVELYDLTTKSSILLQDTKVPHFHHTATFLPNGEILIAGGNSTEIEVFNVSTNTFSGYGNLKDGRHLHTSVLLNDGRVAIIGGVSGSRSLASVEFIQI